MIFKINVFLQSGSSSSSESFYSSVQSGCRYVYYCIGCVQLNANSSCDQPNASFDCLQLNTVNQFIGIGSRYYI
jgi:hypothetical protein